MHETRKGPLRPFSAETPIRSIMPKRTTKSTRAAIWLSMSTGELMLLTTRELLAAQSYSRKMAICYYSAGGQCEEPQLSLDDIAFNNAQWHLEQRVKIALSQPYKGVAREHIPLKQEGKEARRAVAALKDKKQMAYRK
jgi:hypothetical protein